MLEEIINNYPDEMIKVKVKGEVGKRIKIRESLFPEYKGQVFTCIKRDKGQNWFIENGKDKLIVHEYDFVEDEQGTL